jgi:hypothetical protein
MTSCEITHYFEWIWTAEKIARKNASGNDVQNEAPLDLPLEDIRQQAS